LEKRVAALRAQRTRLVRKEATKKRVKAISDAAEFQHWTAPNVGVFAQREDAYNLAQELATQAVELEPEQPNNVNKDWVDSVLSKYVDGTERTAFTNVLGTEADWRNSIINAEDVAGERMGSWQGQIKNLHEHIVAIQALDHNSTAYKKRVGLIPGMRQQMNALRASIKQTRNVTLPEWEGSLAGVQGISRPHDLRGALSADPTGEFGGNIFATQMTIRGLHLKVDQALSNIGTPDNSAQIAALEKLLLEANQRNIARGIEERVFSSMSKVGSGFQLGGLVMPPYAGEAHVGAVVPGPPTQERTMIVRGQERIRTPEQELALAESIRGMTEGGDGASIGDVRVLVHGDIVSSHPDPIEVLLGDQRLEVKVEKILSRKERRSARGAGRRLAGNAGMFGNG
jgi:hypothetical protein